MTVVSDLTKVSVVLKLNNGTINGKVQTVSLSLGDLNINTYDKEKAMNIVNLLSPCLDKDVYEVQEIPVNVLRSAE